MLLEEGFMRNRHYGFLADRCKNDNLKKCRKLSGLVFFYLSIPRALPWADM
jgi:hypothetical protein